MSLEGAVMKVLALVVSTIVATVIVGAGSFAIVFAVPHPSDALSVTAPLVLSALVYGAVVFGSALTYFDPKRSQPSMAAFRRWAIVIVAIDVVALGAMFVFVAISGAPLWLPLTFTVTAVVLLVVAVIVGNALRRYDERRDYLLPNWSPVSRELIVRKVVKIVATFVAAFIVVVVVLLALSAALGKPGDFGVRTSFVFAFVFAFLASGFACVMVSIPLNRQLRLSLNRDLELTRKFARLVLRGKGEDLSDDELVPAARYASIVAITLPFTLASVLLLYVGLGIQLIEQFSTGQLDVLFRYFFLGLFLVVLVVLFPMQIVRIGRARRYAREHEDLLVAESATAN